MNERASHLKYGHNKQYLYENVSPQQMNEWHKNTCSIRTVYAHFVVHIQRPLVTYKKVLKMLPHIRAYPCYILHYSHCRSPASSACVCQRFVWISIRCAHREFHFRMSRFYRSLYGLRPHGLPTLNPFHICVRTIELKPLRKLQLHRFI